MPKSKHRIAAVAVAIGAATAAITAHGSRPITPIDFLHFRLSLPS